MPARQEYRGDGFWVRVEPGFREVVQLVYSSHGKNIKVAGEWAGARQAYLNVLLSKEDVGSEILQITHDLVEALRSLGHHFVIRGAIRDEVIPEEERHAALAQLHELGYETMVLPDLNAVSVRRSAGAPALHKGTAVLHSIAMKRLISAASGKRPVIEILAKSENLEL